MNPPKILIIEDDTLLSGVLVKKLQLAHYDTVVERDGAKGLALARELRPSLVLLDVLLPSLNGYGILEERQKDPGLAAIPFIVLSNSGQPVEVDRLNSLGATDRIVKATLDIDDVVKKVSACLAQGAPHADGSADASPPAALLAGKRIAWVEDDTFLSQLLGTTLAKAGAVSLFAMNGEEYLALLAKEAPPDIILIDLTLPGMSGYEIMEKIRADERLAYIPVIVLSNLSQEADRKKAEQLGAAKLLVKAECDPDEIVREIASVLSAVQGDVK